jgi:hypothetical protein
MVPGGGDLANSFFHGCWRRPNPAENRNWQPGWQKTAAKAERCRDPCDLYNGADGDAVEIG